MASTRITCPDCKSVLRPAKPVPDGKRVKCPKCGTPFTAPGLVEDEEERPRKKVSGKKEKTVAKKAVAPKPSPKKAAHEENGDDEDGGIYGYVKEDEEEEENKPEIEYAPDMSIKDLRGPAQAVLVRPTNYMILIGGLNCLCDILIICVMFWPMVFSEHLKDHDEVLKEYYKGKEGKEAEKGKSIPKERKDLKPDELQVVEAVESVERFWRFILMGVFIFLLIYNGITIIGAVKVQNLESRGWGIASSIMTILPFGSAGIGNVVSFLFYLLFAVFLDDPAMGMMYASGTAVLVWILAIVVGVWSLRVLMSQEVIDGFEYVAE